MVQIISERFKELSLGALKNTTDFALFFLAFGIGLSKNEYSPRGVFKAAQWAEGVNVDSIIRAIRYLKSKGWIKSNLELTLEGQKRLQTFIPAVQKYPQHWKGTWYLVSFDIPEKLAWKRNNFRTALGRLGFGKLHASLWISPYNFLGDVEEYCKTDRLDRYVILGTSRELGTRMSQELADKVWKLEELNERYAQWIMAYKKWKQEGSEDPEVHFSLVVGYSALLRRDPFVPRSLLPMPWYGDRAHKLFHILTPIPVVEEKMKKGRWIREK